MAGTMGRFQYITDSGATVAVKMDTSNAALFGATAATSATAPRPSSLVPRYLLVKLPTGRRRKIICPIPTHALWVGTATDVTVDDYDTMTAGVTAGVTARIGEKRTSR